MRNYSDVKSLTISKEKCIIKYARVIMTNYYNGEYNWVQLNHIEELLPMEYV